ncbi:hypothetical protein DNTS_024698, partial [Danionella cerebrum]
RIFRNRFSAHASMMKETNYFRVQKKGMAAWTEDWILKLIVSLYLRVGT